MSYDLAFRWLPILLAAVYTLVALVALRRAATRGKVSSHWLRTWSWLLVFQVLVAGPGVAFLLRFPPTQDDLDFLFVPMMEFGPALILVAGAVLDRPGLHGRAREASRRAGVGGVAFLVSIAVSYASWGLLYTHSYAEELAISIS